MALESKNHLVLDDRARRLRAVMGLRAHSDGRTVEVDGCRIAVEEVPERRQSQPVVCLHGAGSGSREFRPLLKQTLAGGRLILLDWPGHGKSEDCEIPQNSPARNQTDTGATYFNVKQCVQILSQLLNQLGIQRPILLGCGFGAAVAIRYAADRPSQVRGLVLCQPAGLIAANSFRQSSHSVPPWGRGLARLLGRRGEPIADIGSKWQSLRIAALKTVLDDEIVATDASLRQPHAGLKAALRALHCPILFALSQDNREFPLKRYLSLLDPLMSSAPQHKFTVFRGSFNPIWDEPERFVQALTSFVQAHVPLEQHRHAWILTAVDWPAENTNLWKCVHPECRAERVLPSGINANGR